MKRLLPAIEGVFWEFSSDLFLSFPSLTSSAFRERCEHDSCSRGCEGKAIVRSSAWAKDWALSTEESLSPNFLFENDHTTTGKGTGLV